MSAIRLDGNGITLLLVAIFLVSALAGGVQGARASARSLFWFLLEGALTIVSLAGAWKLAEWISPWVQHQLQSLGVQVPNQTLGAAEQVYYTTITGLRDFALLRFGVLFVLLYLAIKPLLHLASGSFFAAALEASGPFFRKSGGAAGGGLLSAAFGLVSGSVLGAGRVLIMLAVLFVMVTLWPNESVASYIQSSSLYREGARLVIEPIAGEYIAEKAPVLTKSLQQEWDNVLRRKYEIIDNAIPDDIALAAKQVTEGSKTDDDKARKLYHWVGTRVQYDWSKVTNYEERGIWKEQSPEDTFHTKKGVCIDYSRLYAVMARSVGLQVKVDTGLGYDGKGGYGPHAWNEVYLTEQNAWIPLDTTWVSSGGNWYNPPRFDQTHIKDT